MNCEKCGSPLEQGSTYCLSCGKIQGEPEKAPPAARTVYTPSAAAPPPVIPPIIPPPPEEGSTKGGGFFSTPSGKVLAVVLALLVAAGLAAGGYLLVKGGESSQADQAVMDVWNDYEDRLEEDGEALDPVSYDTRALRADQEDLAESIEAVEDLEKDLKHAETTKGGKAKADELADALESYHEYLTALHQYYGELAAALEGGTLKDQKVADHLTSLLDEAQALAIETSDLSKAFIKGNDQVKSKKFDPEVLALADELGPGLRDQIAAALGAEKQRLEAEKAAAEQAAAEAQAAQAAAEAAAAQAQAEAEAARSRGRSGSTYSPYASCWYCNADPYYVYWDDYGYEGSGYYCSNCGAVVPYDVWPD